MYPQLILLLYFGLGQKDAAFKLMNEALEMRLFIDQLCLGVDPRLDLRRSPPRCADLRRMGLAQ
jgi:hypothetical protein